MLWYETLGLKYPIFQGGMAWESNPELVAAVSNAGGLGIIGSGGRNPQDLRKLIDQTKRLTSKVFGVNLLLLDSNVCQLIDVICETNISIVTTGAGNPHPYLSRLKDHQVRIFPVVPDLTIAEKMLKLQIDGLIVEGNESGGYIGTEKTVDLLKQITPLTPIPILAAGGIYDFSTFQTMMSHGADGVQVGTAFLLAEECHISETYKKLICKCPPSGTECIKSNSGHWIRVLKTDHSSSENRSLKTAVFSGDLMNGAFMAGTVSQYLQRVTPANSIVKRIVGEI